MGLIISLCGVDGAGKTTAARLLVEQLKASGVRTSYHHEIDFPLLKFALRIVSVLSGTKRAESMRQQTWEGVERGMPLLSDLYYVFMWLDHLLTYSFFKLKPGVVVYDRWIHDITTVFDHKNYHNGFITRRFLGPPYPNLRVFLTVPPEVACQRKIGDESHTDHDVTYYQTMNKRILDLARHYSCPNVIDANRPVERVVADIMRIISTFLSPRMARA